MNIETNGDQRVFEVQVYLNDLDPALVQVELFANGINGTSPVWLEMKQVRQLLGAVGGYAYRATVPVARAAQDYTARLVPRHDGVAIPLESAHVLWQR
jgi:starch phosphorylase